METLSDSIPPLIIFSKSMSSASWFLSVCSVLLSSIFGEVGTMGLSGSDGEVRPDIFFLMFFPSLVFTFWVSGESCDLQKVKAAVASSLFAPFEAMSSTHSRVLLSTFSLSAFSESPFSLSLTVTSSAFSFAPQILLLSVWLFSPLPESRNDIFSKSCWVLFINSQRIPMES